MADKVLGQSEEKHTSGRQIREGVLKTAMFVVAFYLAYLTADVQFAPKDVLTPIVFVLALAIYVGIYFGLAAFLLETAGSARKTQKRLQEWTRITKGKPKRREGKGGQPTEGDLSASQKKAESEELRQDLYFFHAGVLEGGISEWRHPAPFVFYVFLMVAIPVTALLVITVPAKFFTQFNVVLHPESLGCKELHTTGPDSGHAPTACSAAAGSPCTAKSIEQRVERGVKLIDLNGVDEKVVQKEVVQILETDEDSNPLYKQGLKTLSWLALGVVGSYWIADAVGLLGVIKKGRGTFLVMLGVDTFVLVFHLLGEFFMNRAALPSLDWTFTPTMLRAFSGGMMGVTLIVQCLVYAVLAIITSVTDERPELDKKAANQIMLRMSVALADLSEGDPT